MNDVQHFDEYNRETDKNREMRQERAHTDARPPGLSDGALERASEPAIEQQHLKQPRGAGEAERPLPLFPPVPAAERYPIEALGPALSPAAAAIARKGQVAEAIAGQAVLAAASLAAQAHANVMLPSKLTKPLSLYCLTVGETGDRKSTARRRGASGNLPAREGAP
jgi:hypothetical protein